MKAQININKFALELIDWTEAKVPTLTDFKRWTQHRGYTFTAQETSKILRTSEAIIELK